MPHAARAGWLLSVLLLMPCSLWAQPTAPTQRTYTDWFRDRDFFNPLIAEPRAPQIAFNFPMWAPEFEFSVEPGTRLVWEIALGREIPIFTWANFDDAVRAKGSQGFGVWVDVSVHMIEDMGKDPSNPIINTDYRFSLAKVKYYRVLSMSEPVGTQRSWRSVAIRGDLYHHESTHLGDEFVVNGQGAHPDFERQNVSFEFYDITGAYNWERNDGLLHSVRGGTTGLVKPSHGYYSDHTLMYPESRPVLKSERNFEPYVQYEFHAPHRQREGKMQRWALFTSVDLRRRIVLDFNKPTEDTKEDTQWSLNLLGGVRSWSGFQRFSIKEIYGRVYRGVNPHGQLRNQKDYWQAGIGVNFAVGDR
jgi:hypothetical protein